MWSFKSRQKKEVAFVFSISQITRKHAPFWSQHHLCYDIRRPPPPRHLRRHATASQLIHHWGMIDVMKFAKWKCSQLVMLNAQVFFCLNPAAYFFFIQFPSIHTGKKSDLTTLKVTLLRNESRAASAVLRFPFITNLLFPAHLSCLCCIINYAHQCSPTPPAAVERGVIIMFMAYHSRFYHTRTHRSDEQRCWVSTREHARACRDKCWHGGKSRHFPVKLSFSLH